MSNNIPPQHARVSEETHTAPLRGSQQFQVHIPVLLKQVVERLRPTAGQSYLDLTAGYGGHARAILARTQAPERAVLVDRDEMAIAALQPFAAKGTRVIRDDYAHFALSAVERGERFDMVLVDLGVSSPQFDRAERGFSLKRDGPLDMRMDQRLGVSADTLVNGASKRYLADVIERFGEEPKKRANTIATAIVNARPIHSTAILAAVILKTHRGPRLKTHPATRTFQAFRIVINDELGQLERLLPLLPGLLTAGGRVVILSFHSLEDRLVKRFFKEQASSGYEAELALLGKTQYGKADDDTNPRARSATLRAAVKI